MRKILWSFIFLLSFNLFWVQEGFCENKDFISEETKKLIYKTEEVARNLLALGKKSLKAGDVNAAISYFLKATDVAPYDYRGYFLLAEVFMRSNDYDRAFKMLEKARPYYVDDEKLYTLIDDLDYSLYQKQKPQEDVSLVSIAAFKNNTLCALTHQFDDGGKLVYTDILPMFDQFGFKATIPVNAGIVPDEQNDSPWWGSWSDWQDANQRGFEIANHSFDHIDLTRISGEELNKQINYGYDLIHQKIGVGPFSFVFPLDKSDDASLLKAAERHVTIRYHDYLTRIYPGVLLPTFGGTYFTPAAAEHILQLAMRRHLWIVAECHSLKTPTIDTYKPLDKVFLESHLKYLKENQDKIWVDTTINIFRYLAQKKDSSLGWKSLSDNSVQFKLNSSLKENISLLTVVIHPKQKIKNAAAQIVGQDKNLNVVITKDNQIYLNIPPSNETIVVQWE